MAVPFMCTHVCTPVYIYTHGHVCVYKWVHIWICECMSIYFLFWVFESISVCAPTRICMHPSLYVRSCSGMFSCVLVCICACLCVFAPRETWPIHTCVSNTYEETSHWQVKEIHEAKYAQYPNVSDIIILIHTLLMPTFQFISTKRFIIMPLQFYSNGYHNFLHYQHHNQHVTDVIDVTVKCQTQHYPHNHYKLYEYQLLFFLPVWPNFAQVTSWSR